MKIISLYEYSFGKIEFLVYIGSWVVGSIKIAANSI